MKNKIMIGITVCSLALVAGMGVKNYQQKLEIMTLEEKLANTESANDVLVDQLKQLIGGR